MLHLSKKINLRQLPYEIPYVKTKTSVLQGFIAVFIILIYNLWPEFSWSKTAIKTAEAAVTEQKFSDDDFTAFETKDAVEIYDPFEKYNRKMYVLNDNIDRYFLEYVAKAYRKSLPKPVRDSVRNFLNNLSLPVSGLNSLLQGKVDNGLATFSNFLINSTIGLGGLFDVAAKKGIKYNFEDFGQTMGHYGSGPGAYLFIPLIGPSSVRDFSGLLADKAVNPLGFNYLKIGGKQDLLATDYRFGLFGASGIDARESLLDVIDDIRQESFDPYATFRSAYLQKRFTEIKIIK
jgi:phospholipid-binding lipoprotein MlaA